MFRATGLLASSVLIATSLFAQNDAKFVKEASEGGLAEVELGQLAQEKAQSQAVKDFATRMVIDHSKANEELKGIAAQEHTPVSASLSMSDKTLKLKLEALSGASFDKAYINAMVKDHQADVTAFQKEASSGLDSRVKDFAARTVRTLQDHLAMAQQTAGTIGAK